MYGVATQNGVGVSLGNIPALTSLAYPQMLNAIVLGAFSGGAPGWLYDDTNQSTLFQDAAGTTPVTALEQPVGLQLDLSGRGNHRTQPTSANRPTWSARYNLLTKTDFSTSWLGSNASVAANNALAPDGTTTAATITTTVAGGIIYQGNTLAAGSHTTIGVFKAGSVSSIKLECVTAGYAAGGSAPFDLNAGTKGTVTNYGATTGSTSTITPLGSGYYLCSLTITATAATYFTQLIGMTIGTFTVWHPDLRPSDQATGLIPTYQRVNTASDYGANGFPAGLRWNGSNSWMQNASVDFSGTNKVSLFVGVRKQSDAAAAILTELSAAAVTNPGTFNLSAPSGASQSDYRFVSSGTSGLSAIALATAYTPPITNVVASLSDISAPNVTIRVNGAQQQSNGAGQGGGNYGNYPAYFSARAGTSLFFNGLTFSNVCIGIALSASQIAAFEAWTNARARAYV